jgi:hypothetical protein
MKEIAAALVKAKRAFGPALKDKSNPHFKSRYADLATCIEAVDDALLEAGIVFYQETSEDSAGVTVETVFLHQSGESLRCGKLHVPAAKQDPQGYGSALTYARRYSLMAACGIAAEDDDGNAASKPAPPKQRTGVMADVMAAMPAPTPEDTIYFGELADTIRGAFERGGGEDAFEILDGENLDQEQKLQLWNLLPPNVRAAIKKVSTERNTKKAA